MEAAENICCVEGEDKVDHIKITSWLKTFRLGLKKLEEQVKSGRPKTNDSEFMLQLKVNLGSCTQSVSGELGISQSS